ncbi:MAG: VWA domain-containing protein, partial [Anaerolineales bacterium]|nr:VWA domain-containing protein [Anaerolineales bacterium]
AALVLALARPFLPTTSLISGHTIVLLDASASMQATDIDPNRFAAAQNAAQTLINDLRGDNQMTLIKVGSTPTTLLTGSDDRAALREAVLAADVEYGTADWATAVALATGAAQGYQDARIVIISDGGLPTDLPPLPVETLFLPVGNAGENLAISALATRDSNNSSQLFANVSNNGTQEQTALLSIELDGQLSDSRRITIPAGHNSAITWDIPVNTKIVHARLSEQESDFLALDDEAWAVHASGVQSQALLVTEGNLFLEQVLGVLPGLNTFKTTPGSDFSTNDYDFIIFDSAPLPTSIPNADMLIINPQSRGNEDLIKINGTFSDTTAIRIADSPLLSFVDWSNIHIQAAQAITAPWAENLVEAAGGPLLFAGEQNGRRIAALSFDLRQSDLPLQIAFPILIANITSWLSPGGAFDLPTAVQPGQSIILSPDAGTTAVSITAPDNESWTARVGSDNMVYSAANQPGIYTVTVESSVADNNARPVGQFAVNLFSATESNLQPVESLQIGQDVVDTAVEDTTIGQYEFWPWLAAIALIILLVEWWIFHKGTRLPKFLAR